MSRRASPGTPATLALAKAGVSFTEHSYEHDPAAASFGLEAATALGLAEDHVFKTLLVALDGARVPIAVGIVPVHRHLDLKAMAAACSAKRATMADPALAQRLTGYVLGGISPIGQKRPLPTVLDESALTLERLFVSGGKRGFDIGLTPADLMRVTKASAAPIAR